MCCDLLTAYTVSEGREVWCVVALAPSSLQRTPLHGAADVNVHMMTDEFMMRLMAELGVEIPPFKLHRRMRVTSGKGKDGETLPFVPLCSIL